MQGDETKAAFLALARASVDVMNDLGAPPRSFSGLTPLNATARNKPFQALPAFASSADALHKIPNFDAFVGAESAEHTALQFVFTYLSRLSGDAFDQGLFEEYWKSFLDENANADWEYFAICNLQNFTSQEQVLMLDDGVQIRSRDYSAIEAILGWSESRIEHTLGRDWDDGGAGSHILIAQSSLPKKPENRALSSDGNTLAKLGRTLLALRLTKVGFVVPGRIFFHRNSRHFPLLGISSTGHSQWRPGTNFNFELVELQPVREVYASLKKLDEVGTARALGLALRAFNSIYHREHYRPDDQLVDAITAIEASLRLDTDLSFRSSFQVAGLLASTDDQRVEMFGQMRGYYDTRSKVVHGGELKARHQTALNDHERLIGFVRKLLSGFVRATASGALPNDFYEVVDAALQHSVRREAMRKAFGWN